MAKRRLWGILAVLWMGHATALWAAEKPQVNPTGFTPSQVCGTCHQDIYAMWKDSKHARAFENPLFAAAYREVRREGGSAKELCLRCHAPIAGITGDLNAQQAITREGVGCDFCHSVTGVAIRDTGSPFEVEVGATKRGARVGAISPAHAVQPSILFKSSRLCGGCHEFRNDEGLAVISTFSEWRASSYPSELRSCQDCHFVPVSGRISVQRPGAPGATIPDHRLQRNQEQIREAVKLDLVRTTRNAGRVEVVLAVRNIGSGHAVPTGHPSRRLLLKVEARSAASGALLGDATQTYEKVILGGSGKALLRDVELFLRGREVRDTRITPGQARTETFAFSVPSGEAVRVHAELEYLYRSHVLAGNEWRVQVARYDSLIPAN